MMNQISKEWQCQLSEFFESEQWQKLQIFLKNEYEQYIVYPAQADIFKALQATSYRDVRVVIIGQDPYHGVNQANGLSFSVQATQPIPPSLRNIFTELENDLDITRRNPDLTDWAQQGVLLLNTVLTVRAQQPNSHQGQGWEGLTKLVIERLNEAKQPIVFVLWGKSAQTYRKWIDNPHHLIIESPHPSPLSAYRGFFGSQPFSRINQFLVEQAETPIDWC
ncbi:MAG: uracil-DNA glycosylase [Culicoidibacterales bacterium]